MDNASKALIMAGAILISIAIVGVGVYIFSTTSDLGSSAGGKIDAIEAETTNKELSQFAGTRVRGTEVKALLDKIRVINTLHSLPLDITFDGSVDLSSTVTDNHFYSVSFSDSNADAYLDRCTIN